MNNFVVFLCNIVLKNDRHNYYSVHEFSWTNFNGKLDVLVIVVVPFEKNIFSIFPREIEYIFNNSSVKFRVKCCYYFISHLDHIYVTKSNRQSSTHCTTINLSTTVTRECKLKLSCKFNQQFLRTNLENWYIGG